MNPNIDSMRYYSKIDRKRHAKSQETLKGHSERPRADFGHGLRFIIELEKGKPCKLGKVLTVLNTVSIKMELTLPLLGRSKKIE